MIKNKENHIGTPSPASTFHLEANRSVKGMSVLMSGIIGISDFNEESIVLLSHGGRMMIKGKKLFINTYENHNVEIHGKIEEICFIYGKI